jgi:hypothetical protein
MKRYKFAQPLVVLILAFSLITLACNAAAGLPNPFATSTPTFTPTFTPSPMPSPTPTATLIPTPPPLGTTKIEQSDGTTLFTDYDNKYDVVFPKGWVVTGLNSDDLNSLLQLTSKNNPDLEQMITLLKSMDPKVFRIFAFDFQPDHMVNGFTTNVNIVVENNSIVNAMTLQELVDATAQELPQVVKNIKITSSKVTETASNIPIGLIETNMSVNTVTGDKIPVYEQVIIFKFSLTSIQITLSTPVSMQQKILPSFEQIIDSVKILGN